ncbi:MAG: hypothetical protein MI810_05285 [Flavobacteriales bacterium]|nr:hypothetical protein [Flavobacteriales bacterium]
MSGNEFIDKDQLAEKQAEEEQKEKKKAATQKKKRAKKSSAGNRVWIQIMNGEFLSKDNFIANLPFSFFIGFLLVVMIGWGYYAETITKEEVLLKKELEELNSEYSTLSSEYNTKRGRKPVAVKLAGTGVEENISSFRKIKVRKYRFE